MNSLSILYVDDDKDDFIIIRSLLKEINEGRNEIIWAPSYDAAVEKMEEELFDVFLVDYRLGNSTGIDLLQYIRHREENTPVIVLTGIGDHRIDKRALEAGASDYLVKGQIDASTLERSIRYSLHDAQIRKSLKENERRYRNVFEKSSDAILLIDENGKITQSNPAGSRVFGYTPEEWPNIPVSNLFAVETERKVFEEAMKNKIELIDHEIKCKDKKGDEYDCLISSLVYDNYTSQIIIEDVTRRKQKAEEEQQINKFIATERIARMIAHEIRNPLTNIILSVNGLVDELPAENTDTTYYIDLIKRNSERINHLITYLLDSTKFSQLVLENFSINDLLDETLELAQDRISLKKIQVVKHYSPDICDIRVDKEKIKIAFLNIIINAVEAMVEGKGILSIKTEKKDDRWLVYIIDNGTGIGKDEIDRLFEPFFTSKSQGTGLGLTLAQNIIFNHKGNIRVQSEKDKGSSFIVSLAIG